VEFAEPNFIYTHDAVSNDAGINNLWGMSAGANPTFGCGAVTAWANNKIGSSTVYVGIIDEGYMYTHADLAANAGTNPYEIAGNGIDDDGNGLKDDVYGWDFDGNNSSVYDGTSDDHGTHVAGTIGGVGGNGIGVAGVNWNVKMLSAKFLGRRGGTTANAIKAVDYFTNLKIKGLNIVATNNSWGGGGYSQALFDAIQRANNAGVLFIAAAGNGGSDGVGDNNDNVANYPSNYSNANVIAVASITSSGALSGFSNFGATQVDLGAPGSGIYSTLPGNGGSSAYGSYSGTSMATPHVAGAAALYKSINPGATAAQIKSAILSSVTPTASLSGKTVTGGRLNVSGF
jgi:subtilisin family serine protease